MRPQPLSAPEIHQIDASATAAERLWMIVPVLGWLVADAKWRARTQPIVDEIETQLREREPPPGSIWGNDPERVEVARLLCQVAKVEMGWPNDHFIPADPVDVVFWAHEDGLDVEVAVMELEDTLGIDIPFDEVNRWFGKTLDHVVSWLQHRKAATQTAP